MNPRGSTRPVSSRLRQARAVAPPAGIESRLPQLPPHELGHGRRPDIHDRLQHQAQIAEGGVPQNAVRAVLPGACHAAGDDDEMMVSGRGAGLQGRQRAAVPLHHRLAEIPRIHESLE